MIYREDLIDCFTVRTEFEPQADYEKLHEV